MTDTPPEQPKKRIALEIIQNGSARSAKFKARNARIRYLLNHKHKLKQHIANDTLRLLILEMKRLGLYSPNTHVRDIMIGFPNLIYCVEHITCESIYDAETMRLRYPKKDDDLE